MIMQSPDLQWREERLRGTQTRRATMEDNLFTLDALPSNALPESQHTASLAAPGEPLYFNSDRKGAVPRKKLRISLRDGNIKVNGIKIKIPIGVAGPMAVREFKKFANIYPGNALFIVRDGGVQRLKDNDVVELTDGASFTHEVPKVIPMSRPRFKAISRWYND